MVLVKSIIGIQTDVIIVDDVLPPVHEDLVLPITCKLEGNFDTSKPSVHMTKRSVMVVRMLSSHSSGSTSSAGLVGAGPGFGPQPPGIVQPGRLQSAGSHGSQPVGPGQ
jgi:hypothetical protein